VRTVDPRAALCPGCGMESSVKQHVSTAPADVEHGGRRVRVVWLKNIRPITTDGDVTEQAVAGYVAKYATKAAECVGTLDRRVNLLDDLDALPIRDHARRLIAECLHLGVLEHLADLRLVQWAHMLGFRGHFSTRSRHYSTTLGALRAERADHVRTEAITTGRLPLFDEDTVLVVGHWHYAGRGLSPGDALLAAALTGTPPARSGG
ncbi:MAG: replication initiator, partial [Actinoallomurus sp.]